MGSPRAWNAWFTRFIREIFASGAAFLLVDHGDFRKQNVNPLNILF